MVTTPTFLSPYLSFSLSTLKISAVVVGGFVLEICRDQRSSAPVIRFFPLALCIHCSKPAQWKIIQIVRTTTFSWSESVFFHSLLL